jgi:hypothetical protein
MQKMPKPTVVIWAAVLSIATATSAAPAQVQSNTQPPVITTAPVSTPTREELAAEAKRKAEQRQAMFVKAAKLRLRIRRYRNNTWQWQDVMQVARKRKPVIAHASRYNVPKLRHLAQIWTKRVHRAKYRAHHPPPSLWAWLCIHRHEGPWTSNTNPIYDGGLQMDMTFQRMYGSKWLRQKGPAYNWTMWEQIWSAVRAWRTRRFSPWPNTARACGLL